MANPKNRETPSTSVATRRSTPTALREASAPEPEVLPAPVSDQEIEAVHDELRRMHHAATLELAIAMGRLIIDRFFGGSLDSWRQRGEQDASLRRLTARLSGDAEQSGLSPLTVYRAVGIYDLEDRFRISSRKCITASHARLLIGLPQTEVEHLIRHTEKNTWTAERMEEDAKDRRKKLQKARKGRPALPAFLKTVHHFDTLLDKGETAFGDLDAIASLSCEDAARLHATTVRMQVRCEEMSRLLAERMSKQDAS